MKKILVPFDFSKYAEAALDFAIEMGQVTQGEVHVLNVIEYPMDTTFNVVGEMGLSRNEDKIFVIELTKRTKERLAELTNSEKYRETGLHTHIMMGNPYDGITSLVDEKGLDLIVMGTKGATGLKEMFIGSNAEKVVRRAKCPVITIHKEQKFEGIKDIVYATSLDRDHSAVLEKFKEFQALFGSKLHLTWVQTPNDFVPQELALERLEEIAHNHKLSNYEVRMARGFTPEEGILTYAWQIKAHMIALATHSYRGLAHIFLGSVAENVVNHASIPVWTMSLKKVGEKKQKAVV